MFIAWCVIVGVLLIVIGLTDTLRQELPVSASALYLLAGYVLGPEMYGLLNLRLADDAVLVEISAGRFRFVRRRCPARGRLGRPH